MAGPYNTAIMALARRGLPIAVAAYVVSMVQRADRIEREAAVIFAVMGAFAMGAIDGRDYYGPGFWPGLYGVPQNPYA